MPGPVLHAILECEPGTPPPRSTWAPLHTLGAPRVPATAGTLGLVRSLASLPPLGVWHPLVGRRLRRLT